MKSVCDIKYGLDRSVAPAVRPLPRLHLPVWDECRLSCGARLLAFGSQSCPAPVFQLKMTVAGAGNYNTPGSVAARLLPIVIDQGAASLSASEVAERFESRGAWLRRKVHSQHSELALMGLADTLPVVLDTFMDVVTSPAFSPERFRAITEMKAQELSVNLGKPMTLAQREASLRFWGEEHPASFAPVPEDYLSMTREEVARLHSLTFHPSNMTFYLSGCLDDRMVGYVADTLDSRLTSLADTSTRSTLSDFSSLRHTVPGSYRLTLEGSSQAAIRIIYPSIMRSHPDYELLRLAVTALGGYFGSRLTASLREEIGLTYDIRASLAANREGSMVDISTECRLDSADEALRQIYAEIERMVTNPPSGYELARLKRFVASNLASALDTPLTVLDTAATYDVIGTTRDYFSRTQDAIEQASPEELARVVREHLAGQPVEVMVK